MVKRVCQVIQIKPERIDEYIKVHDEIWPSITHILRTAHFEDYSIFLDREKNLLVGNFKYTGEDWEGDTKRLAEEEEMRRWWALTDSMQVSLVPGAQGSGQGPWWLDLEEVFRFEK